MSDSTDPSVSESSSSPARKKRGPIRRLFGFVFKTILLLVVLLVGAVAFLLVRPTAINLSGFAPPIETQVAEVLGRDFTIDGKIEIITGMEPTVRLSEITVGNRADWESDLPLANLDAVETTIGLAELIEKQINIDDLTLRGLTLSLETREDGTSNFDGLGAPPAEESDSQSEAVDNEEIAAPVESGPTLQFSELGGLTIEDIVVLSKEGDGNRRTLFALDLLEGAAPLAEPIDLALAGSFLGLPFEGRIAGSTLDALRARQEAWPFDIAGTLGDATVSLEGQVSAQNYAIPGKMHFEIAVPELEQLVPITGDLPDFGGLVLAGDINRESADRLVLPALEGKLGEAPITGSLGIDISGEIPRVEGELDLAFVDLAAFRKEEADSSAEETPSALEPVVEESEPEAKPEEDEEESPVFPFVGKIDLRLGEFRGMVEGAEVRDLRMGLSVEEDQLAAGVTLNFAEAPLSGKLEALRHSPEELTFDLTLDGNDAELTPLIQFYTGNDDFEGRFEKLHYGIRGAGRDLASAWQQRQVELDIRNARMLYRGGIEERQFLLSSAVMNRQNPEPGRVEMKGLLSDAPFEFAVQYKNRPEDSPARVRLASIVGTLADVSIHFTNETSTEEDANPALRFELEGGSLNQLDQIYELNLPPLGPYAARGSFRQLDKILQIDEIELEVGNSNLNGSIQLDGTSSPHKLTVELQSDQIQLNDFRFDDWSPIEGSKEEKAPEEPETEETAATESGEEAPSEPSNLLSHGGLSKMDASISLSVAQVLSGSDQLGKGTASVALENGRFELAPFTLGIPGGYVEGNFLFHPKEDGSLDWNLEVTAESFELGVLARRAKPESEFSAIANASLDLGANGVAYGAPHLKAASGRLDIDVCPRNFSAGIIDLWATNILSGLMPTLDPENESKINCLLCRLQLENGVILPETLGLDTTKIRASGEGMIDLVNNEIDIVFTPTPKRPQLFSLELPIGITGSLTEPAIDVGKRPIASAVGKLATNTILFPAKLVGADRLPEDGSDICPCLAKAAATEEGATEAEAKKEE